MKAPLYLDWTDFDIHWSQIGPDHERIYFNHLAIVGYAPAKDKLRFIIYSMWGVYPTTTFKTIAAAKRAARAWVKNWIRLSEDAPILWSQGGSEYHFEAKVNGLKIAQYYKCDEAKGQWHKGFKVYFGNTYFACDLPDVAAAKEAIAENWLLWISKAKSICPPSVKSVAKKSP